MSVIRPSCQQQIPVLPPRSSGLGLGAFFLALSTLLLGASNANAEPWTGEFTVEEVNASRTHEMTVEFDDLTGNLYGMWKDDDKEIYFGVSTDQGATWSSETTPHQISRSGGEAQSNVWSPSLAIGPAEEIVAVWNENYGSSGDDIRFGISYDHGATFSSETADLIASPSSASNLDNPVVVIDAAGTIHIVYDQYFSSTSTREVCYVRSTDGGASWSSTSSSRLISLPGGDYAQRPQIVVGASGRLLVFWERWLSTNIGWGYSDDGGDTWTSESADYEIDTLWLEVSSVCAASSGIHAEAETEVHVSFRDPGGGFEQAPAQFWAVRSTDNGTSWGSVTEVSPPFDWSFFGDVDLAYSQHSGAIAAWGYAVSGANEGVYVSRFLDNAWTGVSNPRLISEIGSRQHVSIAVSQAPTQGDGYDAWAIFEAQGLGIEQSRTDLLAPSSVADPSHSYAALRIYPNPASGSAQITWTSDQNGLSPRVTIFDSSGRQILSSRVGATSDEQGSWTWNLSDANGVGVSNGTYWVRVEPNPANPDEYGVGRLQVLR